MQIALVAVTLLTAACQREQERGEPRLSGAVCATCNSVIAEERFAGQYRLSDGRVKSFDDPVCLFRALRAESGEPTVIRFRDYTSDRWLSGEETWFASTPTAKSPRGNGWAAYSSFGAAQDAVAAAGSGEILSFEQASEQIGKDAQS
jgi:hypothetical protein